MYSREERVYWFVDYLLNNEIYLMNSWDGPAHTKIIYEQNISRFINYLLPDKTLG